MIPILQLTYRKSPDLQERPRRRRLPMLALVLGSILFVQIISLLLWVCFQ